MLYFGLSRRDVLAPRDLIIVLQCLAVAACFFCVAARDALAATADALCFVFCAGGRRVLDDGWKGRGREAGEKGFCGLSNVVRRVRMQMWVDGWSYLVDG